VLKPARLRPGDTVGIVSPSWYGGEDVGHRVERGAAHLRSLGFAVKIAPHALNSTGYVSDTPEHRAADIHALFADSQVRAIIATIGGDHACHLLPLLDWDLLRANPKIFMGFSDITVLNVAIWSMTGLVTFNGPTLMTEWGEYPRMPEYSERYALRALSVPEPLGAIDPATWWTDEFLDWSTKADLTRARERQPSKGWRWLRGGRAEGVLIGGCLESLQHLRGTPYWPNWQGALLFVETSDEKPSPATVDAVLMDYENMGVFEQIRGLLVARPYGYTTEERRQLHEVVLDRTGKFGFPVVADMDFGHTSPMFTLPLGCRAVIDVEARRFAIAEAAIS
jgi:muramoyltetrapeptide carboxypeptidase